MWRTDSRFEAIDGLRIVCIDPFLTETPKEKKSGGSNMGERGAKMLAVLLLIKQSWNLLNSH